MPKAEQGKIQHNLGERLQAPGNFQPSIENKERKCTDCLFFPLLLVVWVAMTAIGKEAIENGSVHVLTNGIDYKGRICGHDWEMTDKKYLYYIENEEYGVCVSGCPSKTDRNEVYACVDSEDIPSDIESDDEKVANRYCEWQIASHSVVNRCVFKNTTLSYKIPPISLPQFDFGGNETTVPPTLSPTFTSTQSDYSVEMSVNSDWSYLEDFMADVWTARSYVFGFGIGFSLLISMIYLIFLRFECFVMNLVWGSILSVFLILVALGAGMFYQGMLFEANSSSQYSDKEILTHKVIGVLCIVSGLIFLCVVCCLRKKIQLAVGIVTESARCMMNMPLLVFFPVLKILGFVLFLLFWITYLLFAVSMGTLTTATAENGLEIKVFVYDKEAQYKFWFLVLVFLWTTQFIIALGQISVALSVSTWYFNRNRKQEVGNWVVVRSTALASWYHSGTAAFGSLLIAALGWLRMVIVKIHYVHEQCVANKVMKVLCCCFECFFWCFEKCVKYINKNAFIQTAIFSYKFCPAAKEAYKLIARNIGRVAAVSIVETFIMFLTKALLSISTTALAYFLLDMYKSDELTSIVAPCILVFILALLVADMVTEVLSMVIATILQCFIADEEMFAETREGCYAPATLKEYLDEHHDITKDSLRTKAGVH